MQTRSQMKRLREIENKVRQEIRELRPMTYGEKLFSDFQMNMLILNKQCVETPDKIGRVKIVKQLYHLIDGEIERLWPTMLRQNAEGIKKLLFVLYNKAISLLYEIQNLPVTMKDHQLLVDTCGLLERVLIKIQPKVTYMREICPDNSARWMSDEML